MKILWKLLILVFLVLSPLFESPVVAVNAESNINTVVTCLIKSLTESADVENYLNLSLPNKPKIAIISDCSFLTDSENKALSLLIILEISRVGKLTAIDPERLEKVLEEHRIGKLGITEKSMLNQVGKLVQADGFLFFSVLDHGTEFEYIVRLTNIQGLILNSQSCMMKKPDDGKIIEFYDSISPQSKFLRVTVSSGWPTGIGLMKTNSFGMPYFSINAAYFPIFNCIDCNIRYFLLQPSHNKINSTAHSILLSNPHGNVDNIQTEIFRRITPSAFPYLQIGGDLSGWPRSILFSPKLGVGILIPFTPYPDNSFYLDIGLNYYFNIGFKDLRSANFNLTIRL